MSEHSISIAVRLRIDFGPRSSIGPGKIALLERIEASGSLSQAARELGMSYRRAWLLLNDLNRALGEPVTTASVGGSGGGGARLTPFGRKLIAAYRDVEHASCDAAAARLGGLAKGARAVDAARAGSRSGTAAAAAGITSIERRPISRSLAAGQGESARPVSRVARPLRPKRDTRARAARRSSRAPTRADRRKD